MELEKNRIPDDVKRIHLIAVCGTGMGALACMLKDLGYEVTGSDQRAYPPMSRFLEDKGIAVSDGFHEDNLLYKPDLVIVGNAVIRDNPEAKKMNAMELNYCSMPQAINHFIVADKKTILVTGTHGKTSTTALIAWILEKAGFEPSFFIGGILGNFQSNYQLGSGAYMVIEGDEYDTAYFNKVPKFYHYNPALAVLTNIEFDHADIYKDIDDILNVFDHFIRNLSDGSILFAYDDDQRIESLLSGSRCVVHRYGKRTESFHRLGEIIPGTDETRFEVIKNGNRFSRFTTPLYGEHNFVNATAAIAVADTLGIPEGRIADALKTFRGVKRRQEIRGKKRGITVLDDFAHHPTAVRETIRAVKSVYPQNRVIAVFEPRTHASMRKVFQDIYPLSFDEADIICIPHPSMLHKIPENDRFSSSQLVEDLKTRGKDAHFFNDTTAIIDFLVHTAKPEDLVLIMSNGGFDNIHERLLAAL